MWISRQWKALTTSPIPQHSLQLTIALVGISSRVVIYPNGLVSPITVITISKVIQVIPRCTLIIILSIQKNHL